MLISCFGILTSFTFQRRALSDLLVQPSSRYRYR